MRRVIKQSRFLVLILFLMFPSFGGNDDDNGAKDESHWGSGRFRWDFVSGMSVFEGVEQGAFHANLSDLSTESTPDEFKYDHGHEIVHDGELIGEIVKFLGEGNMGTAHLLQPCGAGTAPCAAKAVRADASARARVEMEKQLSVEVSISFTLGRHPLIASVIRIIISSCRSRALPQRRRAFYCFASSSTVATSRRR